MILEHSFHTNTRITNWLLDDSNLDKLAQAEAAAIAKYFGMTKQEENEEKIEAEKDAADEVLYRVQVGAYRVRANAEAQLARVKAAGFDAFITTVKVDA
ncbi:MAG: SPOR domain-containing protein [Agathobacter sp.]|nr:SPOR domain-containing protein [Agathobacter sp.]